MNGEQSTRTEVTLELRNIVKSFAGATALSGVSLTIRPGTVHALVGENGAGKSTLGRIIAGVVTPDTGQLLISGDPVRFRTPHDALARGVAMVHQEISLVPTLSVFDNVFLGTRAGHSQAELRERFTELLNESGFHLNPAARVDALSIAEQQKVEIVRALAYDARVIIFDEPTASLTVQESEQLYATISTLRSSGTTIVFVSHFLDEVLQISDDVSILKDGALVRTGAAADETVATLISGMLGRELDSIYPDKRPVAAEAPVVLAVDGVTGGIVNDVTLQVRAGEIVSVFGLIGSGRTELARLILGRDRRTAGSIAVDGITLRHRTPFAGIRAGIGYLPEDRKEQGMLELRSVRENLTLAALPVLNKFGIVRLRSERAIVTDIAKRLELRPLNTERSVATYSGGNQQKVIFGRWLVRRPRVLIADEPTRGVDIGARRALYGLLHDLADAGVAIILISSDLGEARGLGDRIVVMRDGRIAAELDGDATEQSILASAFGENHEGDTHDDHR